MKNGKTLWLTVGLAMLLGTTAALPGAERKPIAEVGTEPLGPELMRQVKSGSNMSVAFWMPLEYWQTAMLGDKQKDPAIAAKVLKAIESYMILAVVRLDFSPMGVVRFQDRQTVASGLKVTFQNAKGTTQELSPLPEEGDEDVQAMLQMIKPIFASSMGKLGQNFHFFVFPDRDAKGKRLADPYEKGKLTVELGNAAGKAATVMEVECPLNPLFVPRECSTCRKKAHVSWSFCPWCGKELPK
jgi:hypothetical protein